jgi:uncharacterized protein YbjT (DUF2867 family)
MANPILINGAAGRVGAVGRTVTELLLRQGKPVRAMVRNEDDRAQALRDMGAEVVIGDLLDLASMHRVIAGCATMYFGMSVGIGPGYFPVHRKFASSHRAFATMRFCSGRESGIGRHSHFPC